MHRTVQQTLSLGHTFIITSQFAQNGMTAEKKLQVFNHLAGLIYNTNLSKTLKTWEEDEISSHAGITSEPYKKFTWHTSASIPVQADCIDPGQSCRSSRFQEPEDRLD